MRDPMTTALLAELAALAEVTKQKFENGAHWEGELEQEVATIANKARSLLENLQSRQASKLISCGKSVTKK